MEFPLIAQISGINFGKMPKLFDRYKLGIAISFGHVLNSKPIHI